MHNQQTNCLTASQAHKHSPHPRPSAVSETYLQDESKIRGAADAILRPETASDLASIIRKASETKTPVTLSGARTGITGGAVPNGGWLVSFEKIAGFYGMRHENDEFFLSCGPGTTLESIHAALEHPEDIATETWNADSLEALKKFKDSEPRIFPPDPTERSASIGGMTACNASGARTFFYGPTRNYISGLNVILAGGFMLDIQRNRFFADEHGCFTLVLPDEKPRYAKLPEYAMPKTKNTAGYFIKPSMDLIDLFIGSEGTLGVFSEIEIRLVKAPENVISVIAFFSSEPDAFKFIHAARGDRLEQKLPALAAKPLSLEYFDANSLDLLREQKEKTGESSGIPALAPEWRAAVSVELNSSNEKMEDDAESLLALLEACGSDPDTAWTALDARETERLKTFRHALPEAVNQRVGERAAQCPGISKLGTDIAVPDNALDLMIQNYRTALDSAQLEYVMFGHIGNNHPHVNILPRTLDEYKKGKEIYAGLAAKAVALGGSVAGEHGIGKLKKEMLKTMYGDKAIEEMRLLKRVFDPDFILNRGNIFDET